jgi:hypothetical protein
MRLLPAALPAALSLTGCANAGPPPQPASTTAAGTPAASAPAASAPAASAPFYVESYLEGGSVTTPAVRVINGFTGQVEATIAAPPGARSLPWALSCSSSSLWISPASPLGRPPQPPGSP